MTIGVAVVAAFFVLMGLVALVDPARILATFGMPLLTADGRNEVRAVYGGFGVAVGTLLAVAPPTLRPGVQLALAAALAGMASGRLVSAVLERPGRFYPCWFYFAVETCMAAVLVLPH